MSTTVFRSADDLFLRLKVADVRRVLEHTGARVASKREELRNVVGENYKSILDNSTAIKSMVSQSRRLRELEQTIPDGAPVAPKDGGEEDAGSPDNQIMPSSTASASSASAAALAAHRTLFVLEASERMFAAVEEGRFDVACEIYFGAAALVLAGARGHRASSLARFPRVITRAARAYLARPQAGGYTGALVALLLLGNNDRGRPFSAADALAAFFRSRARSVRHAGASFAALYAAVEQTLAHCAEMFLGDAAAGDANDRPATATAALVLAALDRIWGWTQSIVGGAVPEFVPCVVVGGGGGGPSFTLRLAFASTATNGVDADTDAVADDDARVQRATGLRWGLGRRRVACEREEGERRGWVGRRRVQEQCSAWLDEQAALIKERIPDMLAAVPGIPQLAAIQRRFAARRNEPRVAEALRGRALAGGGPSAADGGGGGGARDLWALVFRDGFEQRARDLLLHGFHKARRRVQSLVARELRASSHGHCFGDDDERPVWDDADDEGTADADAGADEDAKNDAGAKEGGARSNAYGDGDDVASGADPLGALSGDALDTARTGAARRVAVAERIEKQLGGRVARILADTRTLCDGDAGDGAPGRGRDHAWFVSPTVVGASCAAALEQLARHMETVLGTLATGLGAASVGGGTDLAVHDAPRWGGDTTGRRQRASAVVDQILFVGRVCAAIRASDVLNRQWGAGHGRAGGSPGAGGPHAAVSAALQRMESVALRSTTLWSKWAAAQVKGALSQGLRLLVATGAAAGGDEWREARGNWKQVTVLEEDGDEQGVAGDARLSDGGGVAGSDDEEGGAAEVVWLPTCPSPCASVAVFSINMELQKIENEDARARAVFFRECFDGVSEAFLDAAVGAPGSADAPEAEGQEAPALQLLFDAKLIHGLLAPGRQPGGARPAALFSTPPAGPARPAGAPRAWDGAAFCDRVLAPLQERIDPVDWALYEPLLWKAVDRYAARCALLHGALGQHRAPGKRGPDHADPNLLSVADQAERFALLPIASHRAVSPRASQQQSAASPRLSPRLHPAHSPEKDGGAAGGLFRFFNL